MVHQPVLEEAEQCVLRDGLAAVGLRTQSDYSLREASMLSDVRAYRVGFGAVVAIASDQLLFGLEVIDRVGQEITGDLLK